MKHRGVLVIAHGSSKQDWVELVDQAVKQVQLDYPVATAFLEMVEGRSIPDGIKELEEQGVTEVIAVPLFVSSGSTHIEEISYLLGLNQHPKVEVEEEPFEINAKVRLCPAMDDHPLISDILVERAGEMSVNPAEEVILLVGHGSDVEGFKQLWEKGMDSLAKQIRRKLGFSDAVLATIHPDNLHRRLSECSRNNRVLVLPLFLSEGYFTRKVLPSRMEGLDYVYTGKTYLPSPLISRWIEAVVNEEISNKEAV
ncbi:sirohydrochlorin chelatase [Paenactinomyces guangxiensis]|uniref:Cobalamin biosynthesis protein CbiX n=1 Tax=Paenactinomyces guangxiensis TaxID=1490290 RepID=A0A7W1WT17_9BACL|nr:CbiX/SirB N-terminal domain-containing protein [Paenactinomyces guangxiensis]MBA4495535.1 cobalamin biosynthesis protein CbiX [Paenactinomyces guangxiensis]MBH8592793.1 cobalamin biosynthesis protein CbiX [Paenactinomyces guangxiensis]